MELCIAFEAGLKINSNIFHCGMKMIFCSLIFRILPASVSSAVWLSFNGNTLTHMNVIWLNIFVFLSEIRLKYITKRSDEDGEKQTIHRNHLTNGCLTLNKILILFLENFYSNPKVQVPYFLMPKTGTTRYSYGSTSSSSSSTSILIHWRNGILLKEKCMKRHVLCMKQMNKNKPNQKLNVISLFDNGVKYLIFDDVKFELD